MLGWYIATTLVGLVGYGYPIQTSRYHRGFTGSGSEKASKSASNNNSGFSHSYNVRFPCILVHMAIDIPSCKSHVYRGCSRAFRSSSNNLLYRVPILQNSWNAPKSTPQRNSARLMAEQFSLFSEHHLHIIQSRTIVQILCTSTQQVQNLGAASESRRDGLLRMFYMYGGR